MLTYKIIKTGEWLYFDKYGEYVDSISKESGVIIKELDEDDIYNMGMNADDFSNIDFEKLIKEELKGKTMVNIYDLEEKSRAENKKVIEAITYTLEEWAGPFMTNTTEIIII